ncbi:uncharacterized protein C8Q71DRAFT_719275 [Rhodofomes roseus]|uniref:Uncharacterized protein n=1 Tax=Rhodofomes roseus TaxID=34475 RepID=A0ABQ8KVZ9_9APHY|nr:uncharacterized protein C8Q71DRAFT_719275 [Rhodofomes roseus]KAH9843494.1 hypothetical protein C8Q71DRAFT_719275 [Rhodofomes roseus]
MDGRDPDEFTPLLMHRIGTMLIIGRVASLRMSLSQSGFHWDPEHGADIDKHLEWVWQDYVKKNPGAEKFRNKGWPYYELMVHIMPSTAKGTHGFHPATEETGPTSDQQQPPAANKDPEPAEEVGPDNRSAVRLRAIPKA